VCVGSLLVVRVQRCDLDSGVAVSVAGSADTDSGDTRSRAVLEQDRAQVLASYVTGERLGRVVVVFHRLVSSVV
jgi:hypothetical protein